jgi:hypothetical protein
LVRFKANFFGGRALVLADVFGDVMYVVSSVIGHWPLVIGSGFWLGLWVAVVDRIRAAQARKPHNHTKNIPPVENRKITTISYFPLLF